MADRRLATIQKIAEIKPIDGADSIEAVRVNGWWCVSKKGEFEEGEPCLYFEVDSLLPSSNPIFDFLGKGSKERGVNIDGKEYRGWRLRTIKLRGQLSQGLALPIKYLPLYAIRAEGSDCLVARNIDNRLGEDVSELLGVVKWEPAISAQLAGKIKGSFPGFLKKTDEERVQNIVDLIPTFGTTLFYVTEKVDGTSATFYKKDGVFGVCSRNLELLETEGNTLWEMAKKYNLAEVLPDGICVQGEIVGEGIQQNPLKIRGHELFIYNVYDIVGGRYFDFEFMKIFCDERGLRTVPVLVKDVEITNDVDGLIRGADGKSVLCETAQREGLVYRPMHEAIMTVGHTEQRLSFKIISNAYLLKEDNK